MVETNCGKHLLTLYIIKKNSLILPNEGRFWSVKNNEIHDYHAPY